MRFLVVDHSSSMRKIIINCLKSLGYDEVVEAENGVAALAKIANGGVDVVITDWNMPEMDGFEATRRIRDPQSLVRNHNIPVTAMTAHAMKGDREKCIEAGMDDYIAKPVDPQALAGAIEKWLAEPDAKRGDGGHD